MFGLPGMRMLLTSVRFTHRGVGRLVLLAFAISRSLQEGFLCLFIFSCSTGEVFFMCLFCRRILPFVGLTVGFVAGFARYRESLR